MTKLELARQVVNKMFDNDAFSRWLGIGIVEIRPGRAVLQMKVREDMLNGFDVCHGGITFSLADSALAFASNSHGRLSLALEANMSYPAKVFVGDLLTATAREQSRNKRIAIYDITVAKEDDTVVGLFRGTVYRTDKTVFQNQTREES
jgi:acyl-CoA thioesterase